MKYWRGSKPGLPRQPEPKAGEDWNPGPCLFKAGTWFPEDAFPPRPLLAAAPFPAHLQAPEQISYQEAKDGEKAQKQVNCLFSEKYFHLF